ncbi:MAG: hypothetical protein HC862_08460 [Scytonema sp. RU_4_4]|nr:hypothetical protein [Scytonema sp. RU_4_4]NJR76002.1 hypothetical protein [Scytonema sp. CRU_2_7]
MDLQIAWFQQHWFNNIGSKLLSKCDGFFERAIAQHRLLGFHKSYKVIH